MAATGLTNASCSLIRRGLTVPHPRHWEAMADLATDRSPGDHVIKWRSQRTIVHPASASTLIQNH